VNHKNAKSGKARAWLLPTLRMRISNSRKEPSGVSFLLSLNFFISRPLALSALLVQICHFLVDRTDLLGCETQPFWNL
jgi:hypothetical protein